MAVESSNEKKCLQWDLKSMSEAIDAVKVREKGLRQAAREFGVPVTSLKRRVDKEIELDARPGPAPVLTKEEEDKLYRYCLDMVDMGYGLTTEEVRGVAYRIVEQSGTFQEWQRWV